MIRQGRSVDVPARIAALLDQVGCVVQHGHQALLTAREAPWTLDEGEERYQHLRFLRCGHAKCATHVALNAAVVWCAEQPGA
jgi:hypothetical protein